MEEIVWFDSVDKRDVALVGGKGANLGELKNTDIPVPNGFIVTSKAYFDNLKISGTEDRIAGYLFGLDVENPAQLQDVSEKCQNEIKKIQLDKNLKSKLAVFYK